MAAAAIRSWPARAASTWRALGRMPAYQLPIVLGGALAVFAGAVAFVAAVVAERVLGVSWVRVLLLVAFGVFLILFEPPSAATAPIELRGNRDQVGVRLAMSGFEIACRDLGSSHISPRPTGRRTTSSWPSSSSNRISASSSVVPRIAASSEVARLPYR